MSPTGLGKFIGGGGAHKASVRRYRRWITLKLEDQPPKHDLDAATVNAAWDTLTGDFDEVTAGELREHLTPIFRAAYLKDGLRLPGWLEPDAGSEGDRQASEHEGGAAGNDTYSV